MFTPAELRQLAASAATTYERMEGPFEGQYSDRESAGITEWCRYSAHGDSELFAKQLRALGHTVESAQSLLDDVVYDDAARVPDWVGEFIWVAEHLVHRPHAKLLQEGAIAFSPLFSDEWGQSVNLVNRQDVFAPKSTRRQLALRLNCGALPEIKGHADLHGPFISGGRRQGCFKTNLLYGAGHNRFPGRTGYSLSLAIGRNEEDDSKLGLGLIPSQALLHRILNRLRDQGTHLRFVLTARRGPCVLQGPVGRGLKL